MGIIEPLQYLIAALLGSAPALLASLIYTRRQQRTQKMLEDFGSTQPLPSDNPDNFGTELADDLRKRNGKLLAILESDDLQQELEKNLVLEASLWGLMEELRDKIDARTSEDPEEYLQVISAKPSTRQKIKRLLKRGWNMVGDKAIDKIVGILNGMVGLGAGNSKK